MFFLRKKRPSPSRMHWLFHSKIPSPSRMHWLFKMKKNKER